MPPTERQIIIDLRRERDSERTARQMENAARAQETAAEKALTAAENTAKTKLKEALESIVITCNSLSLRSARVECKRIAEDALQ